MRFAASRISDGIGPPYFLAYPKYVCCEMPA
jgi:hypothetical protein